RPGHACGPSARNTHPARRAAGYPRRSLRRERGSRMALMQVSAVVTGGTWGLGAAVAEALVKQGAQVTLLARSKERGEDVARALGPQAIYSQADITKTDEVEAALDRATGCFGRINVLVNCAGIDGVMKT